MAMAMAPPSSRWPFADRVTGGPLGGELGMSGFVSPLSNSGSLGALRPRSVSPTPLSPVASLTASTQTIAVPSAVSTLEVSAPMAIASSDAKSDGRNLLYVGADRNRDGIADALQVLPPTVASISTPLEAPKDGSLLLQDANVWFNNHRAPLSAVIQDVVTQQFLQIKDSMKQEVERCTQLLKKQNVKCEDLIRGLEAERGVSHTMLIGMRNDFERQQTQISEIVQSRLTASAAQDQGIRERDEEMSVIIQNLRQDIDALRTQSRSTFAGNVAYNEHQQRVEKTYADLRRDFESLTRDSEQFQSVQSKVVKGLEDVHQKVERLAARTKKDKDEREQSNQQIIDVTQQLQKQREHQQQVERVVLEMRKELHATLATVGQQKEQLEDEQKASKAIGASQNASEAAIADLRRQLDDNFGLKRLDERLQRLEQEYQVTNHHITDVARFVNTESQARIELMQSLDAYRAAYLQTSSEQRSELAIVQDRVVVLESVQLEDGGLRERMVSQMEKNLQELQNFTELERQQVTKAEEGMAEMLRKEIEAVAENCATVRGFVDCYMQDLTRMVQEESEARLQFANAFEAYRGKSESAFAEAGNRLRLLETTFQDASELLNVRQEFKAELEDIDARHSHTGELLQRSLLELRELILEGERAARSSEAAVQSEGAALRGSLESVCNGLTSVAADVEVERAQRLREATAMQVDMQALRSQLQHLEVVAAESENTVTELRRITEPGLQSVAEDLNAVAVDMDRQRAATAQQTSHLQTGVDNLRQKMSTLESISNEEKGWRKQAVQDLEVILGDLRHITPTVAASRSLPTLATALRLNRS